MSTEDDCYIKATNLGTMDLRSFVLKVNSMKGRMTLDSFCLTESSAILEAVQCLAGCGELSM